jgi:hypothetical protein
LVLDKVAGITAFHPDTLVIAAGKLNNSLASFCIRIDRSIDGKDALSLLAPETALRTPEP